MAIFAALTLAILSAGVRAQSFTGVGIRPAFPHENNERTRSIFVHTLEPGAVAEDGIKVVNNTPETKKVTLDAVDSVVSSGGSFACAQSADEKDGVGSWISLEKKELTLEPNQSTVVAFTVAAPENIGVGEHNGCITLQNQEPPEKISGGGIAINKRSAIRVSVLVPGEIERNIDIIGLEAAQDERQVTALTAKVENTGNVSADTDIAVWVRSFLGTTVYQDGGQFPVQRGQQSEWNFSMDPPFWGGWYTAQFSASYNDGERQIGAEGGDAVTKISQPVSFFITPQPAALLILGLAALLLVVALGTVVLSLIRKKNIGKNWVRYSVADNETIKQIASKHNISWRKIAKANKLSAPYQLHAGQTIKVPPVKNGKNDRKG